LGEVVGHHYDDGVDISASQDLQFGKSAPSEDIVRDVEAESPNDKAQSLEIHFSLPEQQQNGQNSCKIQEDGIYWD
jgi:hypothetical protein